MSAGAVRANARSFDVPMIFETVRWDRCSHFAASLAQVSSATRLGATTSHGPGSR